MPVVSVALLASVNTVPTAIMLNYAGKYCEYGEYCDAGRRQ